MLDSIRQLIESTRIIGTTAEGKTISTFDIGEQANSYMEFILSPNETISYKVVPKIGEWDA